MIDLSKIFEFYMERMLKYSGDAPVTGSVTSLPRRVPLFKPSCCFLFATFVPLSFFVCVLCVCLRGAV